MKNWLHHTYFLPVFFTVLLALLFIHNSHISLWDQDEGAYAGFAQRMINGASWLIPDFQWSEIHRKTPLHFWNIALSYYVFGENNFAVRFSSSLSIWLLFVAIYRYGRNLWGELTSRLSLIILATSLFVISLAKIAVTDGTLLLFSTVAALAVLTHFKKPSWLNTFIFWFCIAGALLVKGPPILIFMGFFALLLLVFHPLRWKLFRLHPWFFFPLACIPLLAWGRAAWLEDDGEFIKWFIDWYILKRVGGSVLGQSAPFGMHFVFITVVFLPYLIFLPKVWKESIKAAWHKNTEYLVLLLWFVAAWLPYEFSPSKLPAYTVAAHVPLAILIAKYIVKSAFKIQKGWLMYAQISIQCLIYLAIPVAVYFLELGAFFQITSILVSTALLYRALLFFRKSNERFERLMQLNISFTILIWVVIYGQIDPIKNSPEQVGKYIDQQGFEQVVIATSQGHSPSLVVYAQRAAKEVEVNVILEEVQTIIPQKPDAVYIFKEEQWLVMEGFQSLSLDTTICTRFTDRKGQSCYYIASIKE